MPIYLFSNPRDENEIVEVVMSVKDKHVFKKNGVFWNRVFTIPTASVSSISNIDPDNHKQFVDVTGQKRGTYGDLLDLSKELSEKREKKRGVDPIKEKMYEKYSKTHKGKLHPDVKKKKLKENLKKTMFEWSE